MDFTLIVSLGATFIVVLTISVVKQYWQRRFLKQQREICRLSDSRARLASRFVRQLREAHIHTRLEEEYCRQIAEATSVDPATTRQSTRHRIEAALAEEIRLKSRRITKPSNENRLATPEGMELVTVGDAVIETMHPSSLGQPRVAA